MPDTIGKKFYHKIYDSGNKFVATWGPDISSIPKFKWQINGGMGEQVIRLARDWDFGEGVDVAMFNRVKTFIDDNDGTIQIFDGEIRKYDPIIDESGNEFVNVHVVSQSTTLNDLFYKNGSTTEITHSSVDPADIIKDVINKYGGVLTYTDDSIRNTGTSVSYTFNFATSLDAIKKALELAPEFWFWRVNGDSTITFWGTDFTQLDHELWIGKEISSIDASKDVEQMVNRIYFVGGGDPQLYKTYETTSSVNTYGAYERKMIDERVISNATAQTMAQKVLKEKDHPRTVIKAKILDNSVLGVRGYDIESIKPGQIIQVQNPNRETLLSLWDVAVWDVDFWDFALESSIGQPLQVQEVDYKFDHVIIQLSSVFVDVPHRIEDINRNLERKQTENLPSAPS